MNCESILPLAGRIAGYARPEAFPIEVLSHLFTIKNLAGECTSRTKFTSEYRPYLFSVLPRGVIRAAEGVQLSICRLQFLSPLPRTWKQSYQEARLRFGQSPGLRPRMDVLRRQYA